MTDIEALQTIPELKPCPFCGGNNLNVVNVHDTHYFIRCNNHCCETYCEESKQDAIDFWNKRN